MAGKFERSSLNKTCVLFIDLAVVVLCIASENSNIIYENSWFTKYEEVDVTFLKRDKMSAHYRAELYFNTSDQVFAFDLRQERFPYVDEHLKVNVDDKIEIPVSNFGADLSVYTGSMPSGQHFYSVLVRLTSEGLDGMIVFGNEKFYLERISRYISNQRLYENINGEETNFRCILYKASDVKMRINDSEIPWEGHLNASLPGFADTDTSSSGRYKRNIRDASQTECTLHVVADHSFYNKEGNSDIRSTISEMSYLVLQANLIFRGTDFDGDGAGDNIGFHISNITIYTEPDTYRMGAATSVENYLQTFAEYDFSDYCLATAFSSRDFQNGVIGLAWMASSSTHGSSGGICQHRILYDLKRMCLNSNLITTVNNGKRMPSYLNALTLAHEIGHSFGSPHDSINTNCAPEGDYGNFLMFPYASEGGRPNNDLFSPCSISYIYPVVRNKGTCFKQSVISFCGNGFREPGEECDCGTSATCAEVDPCCTPSDISYYDPDHPCTFRRSNGSRCSPKLSHCCTSDCRIVTEMNTVCKRKSECKQESVCDGISRECPTQVAVPDTTPCAGGTKSCKDGLCTGNVCATIGQNSCTCSEQNSCYRCCLNSLSVCLPFENDKNETIPLSAGTTCNAKQGFCDGEGKCISADKASAMDRLNQIFSDGKTDKVKQWFKDQWYYVVLAVLVFIFLIFLFVRTCRGDKHIQTNAYMYGRFSGIQREAELQKAYIERRRNEIETQFKNKLDMLENQSTEMAFPTAVARMMVFFPTAPMGIIIKTLKSSASEEAAVRWLLLRNYPFRRVCKQIEDTTVHTE